MKAKLIKSDIQYRLHNEEGIVIATSLENGKLSIKNCEAIANGYDLDEIRKLADEDFECELGDGPTTNESINSMIKKSNANGAEWGFKKALEILGDKKFSINEVVELCKILMSNPFEKCGKTYQELTDNYIQSLQQTEWDVEIVMDKDCYSSAGRCDKLTMADCIICTPVIYLKDADGCLILRRL